MTIKKNCWFDREGHIFLYITQTVMKVWLVPQQIESWPLSSFKLDKWRAGYLTVEVYYSRKKGSISYWGQHDTLRERRALTYH